MSLNNIGVFDPATSQIYSCLNILSNQQPDTLNGIARFDIAFKILSLETGRIQVDRVRPFNAQNMLTASGEKPSCSGMFETTTGQYMDIIQVGLETFSVRFVMTNGDTLELQLQELVLLK